MMLILLIILSFHVILQENNGAELLNSIRESNKAYLLVGVLAMVLYFVLEACMLRGIIRKVAPEHQKDALPTAIKTTLIGQYYNQITPLSSGGQPMQLMVLKKAQIPVSQGTVILLSKFLYFQIGVTLYAAGLTLCHISSLRGTLNHALYFVLLGLLLNVSGLSFLILMAFRPQTLKSLLFKICQGLFALKILKNREKAQLKINSFLAEYKRGMTLLKNDLKHSLYMFVLTFIQLTLFFSITWWVYKALGLTGASIIQIITLQALLYMTVCFIPLPGSMGASEAGFILILGSVFTGHLAYVALLLWRGISYYFSLLFCGLYTLFTSFWGVLGPKITAHKI